MVQLTVNVKAVAIIAQLTSSLPHALLLTGEEGIGLGTIASSIAGIHLMETVQSTALEGSIDTSQKGVIRIAQIRQLAQKTRGKSNDRRVIIIDDADKMNVQAQNAFLKLLEEPVPNMHFILTSHSPQILLKTILSRVQVVQLDKISSEESIRLISKVGVTESKKVMQLKFLADGRPAELLRLINDESYFDTQVRYIIDAKQFLSGSTYEKILIAAKYQKDRAATLTMLLLAKSILLHRLTRSPSCNLIETIDRLMRAYDRIYANGNIRIHLLAFMVK